MPVAWTISLILKIVLLGFFTYLFAKSIGCSPGASVCAGIVLSLSGFFWSWLPWETVDGALWLPLMCYAVNKLHKTGRGVILTGFSFAMPVLAGHPETAIYVVCFALLFAIFLFFDSFIAKNESIARTKFLLLFCASALLAMGFAAVQLIPTIEWLFYTERSLALRWPPLPLSQALAFLSRDYSCSPNISGIWTPLASGYAGALTLLAACLSWRFPKRRMALWFILAAFISLWEFMDQGQRDP
jgi:hypothetical protein